MYKGVDERKYSEFFYRESAVGVSRRKNVVFHSRSIRRGAEGVPLTGRRVAAACRNLGGTAESSVPSVWDRGLFLFLLSDGGSRL